MEDNYFISAQDERGFCYVIREPNDGSRVRRSIQLDKGEAVLLFAMVTEMTKGVKFEEGAEIRKRVLKTAFDSLFELYKEKGNEEKEV
jgi:hypothetical protein